MPAAIRVCHPPARSVLPAVPGVMPGATPVREVIRLAEPRHHDPRMYPRVLG